MIKLTAKEPSRDITDDITGKTTANAPTTGGDGKTTYRERLPSDISALTVLPKRREQLTDAEPNRQLSWVRDPAVYGSHEDRIAENQELRDDFRIVTNAAGKPHKKGDLVLCSFPMEIAEQELAEANRAADDYMEAVGLSEKTIPLNFTKEELRDIAQKKRAESRRESESRTAGLSLVDAYARYSDEQIQEQEKRARSGGRATPFGNDDWAKLMDRSSEKGSRGLSIGVGRGLGNENPNSALGQVRARDARKATAAKGAN